MQLTKKPICFVIFGPQASGKGTQAQKLADDLNLEIVSTGELIKKAQKRTDELGKKFKHYYESGELAPDNLVVELLEDKLKNIDIQNGVIFDGFPRRIEQISIFSNLIKKFNFQKIVAIYLNVDRKVVQDRVSGRKVCQECNRPYKIGQKAYEKGICESCGGKLISRSDDKPEALKKRLDTFYEKTVPAIEELKNKSTFIDIDGEPPIEPVYKNLIAKLKDEGIIKDEN